MPGLAPGIRLWGHQAQLLSHRRMLPDRVEHKAERIAAVQIRVRVLDLVDKRDRLDREDERDLLPTVRLRRRNFAGGELTGELSGTVSIHRA